MPNSLAYEIVLTENDSIKEDEEINLAEVLLNSLLAAGTMSAANAVKDITNVDNNAIAISFFSLYILFSFIYRINNIFHFIEGHWSTKQHFSLIDDC